MHLLSRTLGWFRRVRQLGHPLADSLALRRGVRQILRAPASTGARPSGASPGARSGPARPRAAPEAVPPQMLGHRPPVLVQGEVDLDGPSIAASLGSVRRARRPPTPRTRARRRPAAGPATDPAPHPP